MTIKSINPSTNQILGRAQTSTPKHISDQIKLAHTAKQAWKDMGIDGRNKHLHRFYQAIKKHSKQLALLMSQEMGMPISEAQEDLAYALDFLNWYSDHASDYLSPEVTYQDDHELHTVYREPYGVAAVIVPWNFPMSNFVWQCGQNLVAGNTVVFKHSEEVILFGQRLEAISREAKLPRGVLNFVHGAGAVGDYLVHQDIDLLCFTGSTKTGHALYQTAAQKFIPVVMELGGSAPGIIFQDADIKASLDTISYNRFSNCGQICDGLKRLIVHHGRLDETLDLLTNKTQSFKIGNATDPATTLGPLVADRQLKLLEAQVADAVKKGAQIIAGGTRPPNLTGSFFEPTLVTNVTSDMRLWREEVFGPVLPIATFQTEAQAVNLANDTQYGLGGYVFTKDHQRFDRVASRLQTGMVSLNNVSYVRECNPFGGYKHSGLGREHGQYGFADVTQVKLVSKPK